MRRSLVTLSSLVLVVVCAASAHAALRSPQVPVAGTALASFFVSQGQTIDPAAEQADAQTFAFLNVGIPVSLTFQVHAKLGNAPLYVYNAGDPGSPLYTIFPGSASTGWFTAAAFRTSPDRLVVNLFDALGSLQGTTTYLGVQPFQTGLAVVSPGSTKFSEDALNTGGARILFFAGTGAQTGNGWLCAEDQDGGTGDFADQVFLLEWFGTVESLHTTWGGLKARFR